MGYSNRNLFLNINSYTFIAQHENKKIYGEWRISIQVDIENFTNNKFISSFGNNYVTIDGEKFYNLLVCSDKGIKVFRDSQSIYESKILEYLQLNLEKVKVDLILFGTGKNTVDLPVIFKKYLIDNKISYELMNSISAYKTHNILLEEKRNIISVLKLV